MTTREQEVERIATKFEVGHERNNVRCLLYMAYDAGCAAQAQKEPEPWITCQCGRHGPLSYVGTVR